MQNILFIRMSVPIAAALLVLGCSSSHQRTSYSQVPQGAPAYTPTTEVITASGGIETNAQAEIQLHKEEMVVGKRAVSSGGVLVRTVVQTENVSQPVELYREEYVIERVPASEVKGTETAFQAREIYIPLTREEPVASKRVLLSEKVQLGKRLETDHQTVSSPVRSEDVEITKFEAKPGGIVWQEPAAVAAAPSEANSLKLAREEMVVGKATVENGGVKLQKIVRTQTASQPVDLTREEYTLDRSPATEPQEASADFSPKEIRLNLSRQEAVVGTRVQPTEWVRVRKQVHTDTQTVSGTVRKEGIELVKLTPEQAPMGGTGIGSQSGATVISESSTPEIVTITGNAFCAKCQLHQVANCQPAIRVQNGSQVVDYYLVQDDVNNLVMDPQAFHDDVCEHGKKVTATGSVRHVDGKIVLAPSSITVLQ